MRKENLQENILIIHIQEGSESTILPVILTDHPKPSWARIRSERVILQVDIESLGGDLLRSFPIQNHDAILNLTETEKECCLVRFLLSGEERQTYTILLL